MENAERGTDKCLSSSGFSFEVHVLTFRAFIRSHQYFVNASVNVNVNMNYLIPEHFKALSVTSTWQYIVASLLDICILKIFCGPKKSHKLEMMVNIKVYLYFHLVSYSNFM